MCDLLLYGLPLVMIQVPLIQALFHTAILVEYNVR